MLDQYNIGIYQGTSYKAIVQWKDDITQQYVDLTNATCVLQARFYYGGPIIIESSTVSGGISLDNSTHNITIRINPAQTIAVGTTNKPLFYDVLLLLADGTSYKILEGTITILPTVVGLALQQGT